MTRDINIKIGAYLKKKRKSRSFTGGDIAAYLGVTQQQISRYERGQNNLTVYFLSKYLSVLEVDWVDFVKDVLVLDTKYMD